MSWISDATDWIGSAFDDDPVSSGSGGGVVVPNNKQEGGGLWSSDLWGSVINAGVGLAGTYFKTSQDKKLAEAYAKQRLAEIEAAKKAGGGGGGGGASQKQALMAQMYNNWAALTQKSAAEQANTVLATGKLMQDPIISRAGRL